MAQDTQGIVERQPSTAETSVVLAILDSFFLAIGNGTAWVLQPNPKYKWKHWPKGLTLARMKEILADLDSYLSAPGQMNYVISQGSFKYNGRDNIKGPELSRLPDHAVRALFQQLDAIYYHQDQEHAKNSKIEPV